MSFQITTRNELKDFRTILTQSSGEGLAKPERDKYGAQRDGFWKFIVTIASGSVAAEYVVKALSKAVQGKAADFGSKAFAAIFCAILANDQYRFWSVESLSNQAMRLFDENLKEEGQVFKLPQEKNQEIQRLLTDIEKQWDKVYILKFSI